MINKKIFLFLFLGLFLLVLPVVSAVKIEYSPNDLGVEDMQAHIEDTILFNLITIGEMGTFELKSHKSPQEILKVGLGDQVVMYYDIDFKDAQSGALGNVTFINLRTGKEVERDWKFVYLTTNSYEVPVYECSNSTLINGTSIEDCYQSGTKIEEREEWLDYNSKDIPKGKIRIGIMVDVQYMDYIDGIWEVEGKKIDRHAGWEGTLTLGGATGWSDEGAIITEVSGDVATINAEFWVTAITKASNENSANAYVIIKYNNGTFVSLGSASFSGDTATFTTPIHVVTAYNSVWFATWSGGSARKRAYKTASHPLGNTTWFSTRARAWANDLSGTGYAETQTGYQASINSVSIRNYAPVSINLISPVNGLNSNNKSITFIGNTTETSFLNFSLVLDGVVNETNTSSIVANYYFNKILADGSHNWTMEVCTISGCQRGETRNLTIDTTPFIEFIPPTLPNYANTTNETIPMYVNVSTLYFFNISYDLYNVNGTHFNQYYETETFNYNFTNIPDAHYHYNVTVCTTTGRCNVTETRHINHDVTPPEINISSPVGAYDYLYVGEHIDLNFTVTDAVANVSSCWYNYNGTNISVACTNGTLISSYFVLENNNNNLTLYANDTFGNVGSEFISWTYKVLETAKEYNNETLEGTFEDFKLYLTKGSGVNVQSVVLHYDGQTHTSSLFSSGSDVRAESELFISDVTADTNNTLYFTVTLSDSTVFNTSTAVQLVRNIVLDDCSSQPKIFLNVSLVDEEQQTALSGSIEIYLSIINPDNFEEVLSFNGSYSGVSSKAFCSNILLNQSSFLLGAKIRYDSDNHSAEFYNIQRSNLSSYPKTYILYDLKDEDTTKFKLIYRGENLIGVTDAIIQLQREYISEGVYKIVEAPLTSSESTAVVHIDTNTNSYKATVVKNGVVLNTFENLVFICQSELTGECTLDLQDFIVPPNSVSIDSIQDFSYSISSDIDNKTITLDYSVPTGTTSLITVVATQKDIVGEETICNTTVSSAGGSIECGYNESIQDSYIYYNIYKDGVQLVEKSYIVRDDLRDDFGGDNYFILIVFAISLIFMAILSPEWIVLNSIISIIIGGATWLIRGMDFVLGLGAIAWLLLGAVIVIIKMSQKEDE